MEKIKVVEVVADSTLSGGASHVLGILTHLDQKRFEPFLICPKGTFAVEADKINGLKVFTVEMRSKFDLSAIFQIRSTLQRVQAYRDPFGPMIVHSHGLRAGFLTRIATPRAIRSVYTEHLYNEDYHLKNALNESIQKRILRYLNKKTDKVIAVSTAVQNFLIKEDIVDREKVMIIPNAVDLPKISQKETKKIKAANRNPIIGTIGNLNFQKGHSYLIDAMKLVLEKYPQATCEIIGEGEERDFLTEKIKNNQLDRHITLLGRKANIQKHLKYWDVFVLPSVSETFGIVVLEAMASGVPVVANKVGGVVDIIQNRKNGLLAQAKNVKSLSSAILEILDHPVLAAKLKREGLVHVKDFDWTKIIKQIEDLYFSLFDLEKKNKK